MERCPKCGARREGYSNDSAVYACGSVDVGPLRPEFYESDGCLRRQLAAATERADRLMKALPDPKKLRLLVRLFDERIDPMMGWTGREVQQDLTKWADAATAAGKGGG